MILNKYIWGAGSHAKCVASIMLEQMEQIESFIDENNNAFDDETWNSISVINANDIDLNRSFSVNVAIGDNLERKRIHFKLAKYGISTYSVISDRAIISIYTQLGNGCQLMRGAIVCNDVLIGDGVLVNSGAVVEHGCNIGKFCHIAPNAVVLGNCQIGEGVFIGANATIFPNVRLADGVKVGSGVVVRKSINEKSAVIKNTVF